MPKVEGGNNFGIDIQESIDRIVSRTRSAAQEIFNNQVYYPCVRAKYMAKVEKHPTVTDYASFIHELDKLQYETAVKSLLEISDKYSVLFDVITKNLEKIINPRSSDGKTAQTDYYQ